MKADTNVCLSSEQNYGTMQLECVGNDKGIGYSNSRAKGERSECNCLQMKLGQ